MTRRDVEQDLRPVRPAEAEGFDRINAQELSLRELVDRLSSDVPLLLRQELQLAKAEINERLEYAKKDAVKALVGGAVAYAGVLAIVCGVIAVLSYVLAVWLTAFVVGVLLCIAGFVLLQKGGKHLAEVPRAVERPADNIKTDLRVFKEATQ